MGYFLFTERVRERDRARDEKRERAISEEIAAHCDTVHTAPADQSEEDGESRGGQSSQNPPLGGLNRRKERGGGGGKQRTEISGKG